MNRTHQGSPNSATTEHQSQPSISQSYRALQTPLRFVKGVGPKRAEQLENFGLRTIEDLLYHVPFRYEDRRHIKKIGDATPGKNETFVGQLVGLKKKYIPRRRSQMLLATLVDESGRLGLVWYRAPSYLVNRLIDGEKLLVHGMVEERLPGQKQIVHPEFEAMDPGDTHQLERILPIYYRPGGLPSSLVRKWIGQALAHYAPSLPGCVPQSVLQRRRLLPVAEALAQLHQPGAEADISSLNNCSSRGHRSVIFDELFSLQLALGLRKRNRATCPGLPLTRQSEDLVSRMRKLLRFQLTRAQERVLAEIIADMGSAAPMQRLVQGDVGSGKTIVAWLASLHVIEHGYQALWMAPTEILAEQHFRALSRYCEALGIKAALLTASLSGSEKRSLLDQIEAGRISMIVGTHALIQEGVRVPGMGLGVIDEQHRFGVIQRISLQRLREGQETAELSTGQPHMLLMSATPIPRSLAMVLYGDMEVSFLDEMPPGRKPVTTKVFRGESRRQVYSLVLDELRCGHQAFIVYPLVEVSEQLQEVRDATQMAEKMRQGAFKEFGVGLVHGRMTSAERDQVMRAFRDGGMGVLVATTVIEVGIDIPNATVIVIEHAERFGLSQLHQLRGRVGRGLAPGHCLLVNRSTDNPMAAKRLAVMEREHDGFKIAEADLALRGPGELLGTRQSGMADFRLANLVRDSRLLVEARKEALAWLEKDPDLVNPESAGMKGILGYRWGRRLQLGAAG